MADNIRTTPGDVYNQFEKWLNEQPYWTQDAAYRIYHGLEIDDAVISLYVDMCISQTKKEQTDYKRIKPNESKKQMAMSSMTVLKMSEIVGVNALSSDANLEFLQDGVTVVYGLNGAGKSGFMRIFKQLSGNPYKETIKPDVYKKTKAVQPSCKFVVSEDDQEREIVCDLSSDINESPLSSCDVFDTRISNDYITKTNNVSYQPFVFTVLTSLATIAGKISKHIDQRIEAIPDIAISLPESFSKRKDIAWLQNLSASTVFPQKYYIWTEDQQRASDEISRKLDTEKVAGELRLCKSHLASIVPVLDDLVAADALIKEPALSVAYESFIDSKRKLDAAELLFTETADSYDKASVSVSDWKELWRIAQRYYESAICSDGQGHFGEEGTICPLCHQVISGNAVTRFKSVNDYVNGTCSSDYNKALSVLKKLLKSIISRTYSLKQIKNLLSDVIDEAEVSVVEAAYANLEVNTADSNVKEEYARILKINNSDAITLLSNKKKDLEAQQEALELALKSEGRTALQNQFADLTCHKWIYDNRTYIEEAISNLKKRQELSNTRPLLTTNKITIESNRLASVLITEAYIDRFMHELNKLAPRIKVKLEKASSQKGSTPYKVTIDTDSGIKCKPEDILSEGEQRIVALAAFFADATGRECKTPLIIDDPISSLDLLYEEKATREIVRLATERQVIVFTHRISLLVGMKEACKNAGIPFSDHYIRSTKKGNGLPDFEDEYTGDLKAQLNGLKNVVRNIEGRDPDSREYNDAIWRACQTFRKCVERSVEDVLLLGMVHRFDRRIMTNGKVLKLTRLSVNDVKIIDDMMTKYSFTEHSQPIDSPPVQIDTSELKSDIQSVLDWIKSYNRKMN